MVGVVQAGPVGAAQPVDASREGQVTSDDLHVRREAERHDG